MSRAFKVQLKIQKKICKFSLLREALNLSKSVPFKIKREPHLLSYNLTSHSNKHNKTAISFKQDDILVNLIIIYKILSNNILLINIHLANSP